VISKISISFFQIIPCTSVVLTVNIPIHGIIHMYNSTVPTSHPKGGGGVNSPILSFI
jgi:hypothetical protein